MSGSYQRPEGQTEPLVGEPITTDWSPRNYYGSAAPYGMPGAYGAPGAYGTSGAYGTPAYGAPGAYQPPGNYQYPPIVHGEGGAWPPQAGGGGGWGGWPPHGGYWPPQPLPQPPRRHTGLIAGMIVVVMLVLVAAVGVAIGVGRTLQHSPTATGIQGNNNNGTAQNGPGATGGPTAGGNLDSATIAASVNKYVVDVNTVLQYQNARAAGTGIVIGSSGLVLTNNHVVAGATSISVTEVTNGKTYSASVVGYDRTEDIAVIQMKGASGLPTASIGDSSKVSVGDSVLAIGNAGGTGGTPSVAEGSVSALNQSITASDESTGSSEQLEGLIQVAADIRSGDSGGPLVNSAAQVIGINTAASASGNFQYQATDSQGFAIPISQAMTIGKQITAGKASTTVHIGGTGFLGVSVATDRSGTSGAVVKGVISGSPAESAGLSQGDVITSVDGQTVDSPNTLTNILDKHHPDDRVRVVWTDSSGQTHSATLKLMAGPVG
jgi:S1-C subfamily serine protease